MRAAAGTTAADATWSRAADAPGTRPWLVIPVAAAAVALGVFADVGSSLGGFVGAVPELGVPWVALAWLAGRQLGRPLPGALAGACTVALGLASYFAWVHFVHGVGWYNVLGNGRGAFWFAAAAVFGGFSGWVATWSLSSSTAVRVVGRAFLPAVCAVEAWRTTVWGYGVGTEALTALLVVAAALGAAAVLALHRPVWLPAAALAGWLVVGAGALVAFRAL